MLRYSLEKELTLDGRVHALAFSPSGQFLAVALKDRICVWETTTWALDLRFYRDSVQILSVAWNVNNQLFFGCDRGFLTMVSWEQMEYHSQGFRASEMEICFIAISSDTRYLALGGGSEVTIWEMVGDENSRPKWVFVRKLDDPQDQYDKTNVNVTGVAWANKSSVALVVSYERQGVVTWNVKTGLILFMAGRIPQQGSLGLRIDAPQIIIDGGPYFAIPSGSEIRVYDRQSGRVYRCLYPPAIIPHQSPIIWAHEGSCIIAALESEIVLLHIEKRRKTVLNIEECHHITQNVTNIAWNKSLGDRENFFYRVALVTNGNNLNIVRADAPLPRERKPKFHLCRSFKLNCGLAFLFVAALYLYIRN